MTSRLAADTIAKWEKEGLKPTFEDMVRLNDIGLKVERGSEAFSFAACPRVAFLGDHILREPTVAKRIWMDCVGELFQGNYQTRLFFLCYALNCPDAELPDVRKTTRLAKKIEAFRDAVLLRFTETQLVTAIDYVLNGNKPDLDGIEEPEARKAAADAFAEIYDVPVETQSAAKQLLLQALTHGIDASVKYEATLEDLERMITVAALYKGADVLKNEHTQWAARFYAAAGKIHARLVSQQATGEGK